MIRWSTLHRLAAAASVVVLSLWTLPAHGYRMIQNASTGRVTAGAAVACDHPSGFTHWTTPNIAWRLNTAGQGAGKTTAISNAIASWRNVADANHNPTYAGTTTNGWATDGANTVLWASGNGCSGNCLALTALVLQAGQVIVESDITFNSAKSWTTNGSNFDTQTVAAHEFGHSLGIHHTEVNTNPLPTMRTPYFGSGGRTLETDDRSALQCSQCTYPPGAVPGPRAPASMSSHTDFCEGWATLSWSVSSGATYYEVQRSSSFSFSFPRLAYRGSSTSIYKNVAFAGNGRTFFRVRACNSNGCGCYRYGGWVKYYPQCL